MRTDTLTSSIASVINRRNRCGSFVTSSKLGTLTTAYSHNLFGETDTVTAALPGETLFEVRYQSDKLGRITAIEETIAVPVPDGDSGPRGPSETRTLSYGYDAADRLPVSRLTAPSPQGHGVRFFLVTNQQPAFFSARVGRNQGRVPPFGKEMGSARVGRESAAHPADPGSPEVAKPGRGGVFSMSTRTSASGGS